MPRRGDRGRHERVADARHPGTERVQRGSGAQNAFVQIVGSEVAPHNVQVNAIGPALYYTTEMLEDADVREQLVADIPAGRIGEGEEAAELALATDASKFMAGQMVPISGGWVT